MISMIYVFLYTPAASHSSVFIILLTNLPLYSHKYLKKKHLKSDFTYVSFWCKELCLLLNRLN